MKVTIVAQIEAEITVRLPEDQFLQREFHDIEGASHDKDLPVVADFHHAGKLDRLLIVIDRVLGLAGFPTHLRIDDQRVFFESQGSLLDVGNDDRDVSAFSIDGAGSVETIVIHDPGSVQQAGLVAGLLIQVTCTRGGQNGHANRRSGQKELFHDNHF